MTIRLVSNRPAVYLAGPSVFAKEARVLGELLKFECEQAGLLGLWPLDSTKPSASEIYAANLRMIDGASALIVDVSPFRGPHMDPGTAFEVGYAVAKGLPLFCWSVEPVALKQRIADRVGDRDKAGQLIEDFDLVENLMIGVPGGHIFPDAREAIRSAAQVLKARRR